MSSITINVNSLEKPDKDATSSVLEHVYAQTHLKQKDTKAEVWNRQIQPKILWFFANQ